MKFIEPKIFPWLILFLFLIAQAISGDTTSFYQTPLQKDIGLADLSQQHLSRDIAILSDYIFSKMISSDAERAAYCEKFKKELPDYFESNLRNGGISSLCQRMSLSLAEILSIYGIRSRQWHCNNDGTGIHQFLEYRDPSRNKWVIFGPYYGIMLRDKSGIEMGVNELRKSIEKNEFSEGMVVRVGMKRPPAYDFYKWPEIEQAFRSKLVKGLTYPRRFYHAIPDFYRRNNLKKFIGFIGISILVLFLVVGFFLALGRR